MSKVLILPDIHGRGFWKTPCKNWEGQIVFLGDYHDPYGEWMPREPKHKQSRQNLAELVKFIEKRREEHPYSVICLWGNHDESYRNGFCKCRFDDEYADEVYELLKRLKPQIYFELWDADEEPTNKFLFSHAGITKDWIKWHNLTLEDLFQDFISGKDCKYLDEVPYSRGGYSQCGSCIWNSLEDYATEIHLPEYYQIFGHTWGGRTKPVINEEFAMLDCGQAFVLDTATKEIKKWNA